MASGVSIVASSGSGGPTTVLLDTVDATLSYVGKAPPNSDPANAVWQIQRIQTVGTLLSVEYADGNNNFDNIWNNRAALPYS